MTDESKPASFPLSITPDAMEYLSARLGEIPPEACPMLMLATSQTDGLNPPRWLYEGQSFILGFFDPAEKPEGEFTESELLGRRVAIGQSAMKQLAGRTLRLRRVSSRYGLVKNPRDVLVADSGPESSVSEADDSSERIKRIFFVAVLTILGGFTGIGVIWIVAVMVLGALKIQGNKFLAITPPLFVIGWILGAAVSFVFFRSLFKTKGKTKFAQEQKQQKYLGYGGLDIDLDLWIFFGIPVPLTAFVVFALEPLARTVGQKTGVAFAAIMVVFTASMYFCERIPRRLVFRLGIIGWVLACVFGYWFFTTHGL